MWSIPQDFSKKLRKKNNEGNVDIEFGGGRYSAAIYAKKRDSSKVPWWLGINSGLQSLLKHPFGIAFSLSRESPLRKRFQCFNCIPCFNFVNWEGSNLGEYMKC